MKSHKMRRPNYLRYARTKPIRSSASSTEGIGLFSWPIMCKRMWSSRISAIQARPPMGSAPN